jgi:FG-GAP repeat
LSFWATPPGILFGNGDGTFQPHVNYPVALSRTAVGIMDVNHDGNLDLALANPYRDTVTEERSK